MDAFTNSFSGIDGDGGLMIVYIKLGSWRQAKISEWRCMLLLASDGLGGRTGRLDPLSKIFLKNGIELATDFTFFIMDDKGIVGVLKLVIIIPKFCQQPFG